MVHSIKEIENIKGKRILLRVDFNVPIEKGVVEDDYKIIRTLPTIRFLQRYKCRIIIMSHLGRPENKEKEYSLRPVAKRLEQITHKKVRFVNDCIGLKTANTISKMKDGEIVVLENLRFHKEEKKNDVKFAKELAELADIYVNEAFANSHRAHASMHAIKEFLPSFGGLLLADEIKHLEKVLKPKEPLVAIVGGIKMKTKIPLIKKLNKKAFKILTSGGAANIFLKIKKIEIGESPVDNDSISFAKKIKKANIILPTDAVVGNLYKKKLEHKNILELDEDDVILDIGEDTIELFENYIGMAKTIIWNGPLGKIENKHFRAGTVAIARAIAKASKKGAFSVVGGGETVESLKMAKVMNDISWVSTGGGAMLSYLGGEPMPGLEKILS